MLMLVPIATYRWKSPIPSEPKLKEGEDGMRGADGTSPARHDARIPNERRSRELRTDCMRPPAMVRRDAAVNMRLAGHGGPAYRGDRADFGAAASNTAQTGLKSIVHRLRTLGGLSLEGGEGVL